MNTATGKKAFIVLDRDGTIMHERFHLTDPEGVELLPGAAKAIRAFSELGFGVIVATNQSVIGRGLLDKVGLQKIHDRMKTLLAHDGASIDGIYICPHTSEDGCACRKPATGLIDQALKIHDFDPTSSFVIGDKKIDIDFGKRSGAKTILVRTGYGREVEVKEDHGAEYVVDDLRAAADLIQSLV